MAREKYKAKWPDESSDLQIELACIARDGKWVAKDGTVCGDGMLNHLFNARALIWPERYRHRWTNLLYEEFVRNDITIMMGAASTQKTSHASEFCLLNYWARPETTLIILSTITVDKLDTGVYGELKMLWQAGRKRHPFLAGNLLESKRAIVTDNLEESKSRDMRRGCVSRACFPSGTLVDTPRGKIAIEKLRIGDPVFNAAGIGQVTQTLSRIAEELVRVTLADGRTIDCTPNHPIFTQRGWVKAIDIRTWELVFSPNETLSLLQQAIRPRLSKQEVLFRQMPLSPRCFEQVRELPKVIPSIQEIFGTVLQRNLCGTMGGKAEPHCSHKQEVPLLQQAISAGASRPAILFHQMPQSGTAIGLRAMQEPIFSESNKSQEETAAFLRAVLRREMEHEPTGDCFESIYGAGLESGRGKDSARNLERSEGAEEKIGFSEVTARKGGLGNHEEIMGDASGQKTVCFQEERKGKLAYAHRGFDDAGISGGLSQYENVADLLPGRPVFSGDKVGRGVGRGVPPEPETPNSRQEAGCNSFGTRVVSVEILKRNGVHGSAESEGGYRVYNLEVSGHPSYSVNDVIVHNCYQGGKWVGLGVLAGTKQENIIYLCDEIQFCAASFLGSWPNLFSNGNVKIIGSGNPKHDPDDQLGIASEPKEGWSSQGDNKKTAVWETQFMGGRCVNLVGIDSPNFDVPEDQPEPYPKLIGRKFEKRIRHDYSENSPEYFTQVMGVMRIDMADQRVITRQLCRTHLAHQRATWKGTPTTKIYGLDPSYGGGDQCMKTIVEFGEDIDGQELIEIIEQSEIVIDLTKRDPRTQELISAEDQIADKVAEDLIRWNIPHRNAFYDPYGKGTMGFAFARKFGQDSPIPVDSGGPPTERPVRDGLYLEQKDGKRRLKTCREHYSKFVTEAWFSTAYAIQAKQVRNLPVDCMLEGCARKYETVAGNRISVESKDDYKARARQSPNKYDSWTIAVEGARQRGFHIAKLGKDVPQSAANAKGFEEDMLKYEAALKAGCLTHQPQIA